MAGGDTKHLRSHANISIPPGSDQGNGEPLPCSVRESDVLAPYRKERKVQSSSQGIKSAEFIPIDGGTRTCRASPLLSSPPTNQFSRCDSKKRSESIRKLARGTGHIGAGIRSRHNPLDEEGKDVDFVALSSRPSSFARGDIEDSTEHRRRHCCRRAVRCGGGRSAMATNDDAIPKLQNPGVRRRRRTESRSDRTTFRSSTMSIDRRARRRRSIDAPPVDRPVRRHRHRPSSFPRRRARGVTGCHSSSQL